MYSFCNVLDKYIYKNLIFTKEHCAQFLDWLNIRDMAIHFMMGYPDYNHQPIFPNLVTYDVVYKMHHLKQIWGWFSLDVNCKFGPYVYGAVIKDSRARRNIPQKCLETWKLQAVLIPRLTQSKVATIFCHNKGFIWVTNLNFLHRFVKNETISSLDKKILNKLTISSKGKSVSSLPVSTSGTTDDLGVSVSFADSSVLATSGCESSQFTMFVHGVAYPVESGVTSDCLVCWVDTDNLVVFVYGVLSHPVTEGKFS